MSRNGAGTYVLTAGNPVVTGTTISSSAFNTMTADMATALTNSIAANGETPITNNIPMGGNKITGLGAGAVSGDAVRYEQLIALTIDKAKIADLAAPTGASLVGWIQTGSGALAATVQDKLREMVSSKDLGALGGLIDDTTAIQAAFAASATKLVLINTASRISASINVPSSARIVFAPGAKLIPTGRFTGAIKAGLVNDWIITDARIEGLAGVATDTGIDIDGCLRWSLIRPSVSGLGLANPGSTADGLYGAHGISVNCTTGQTDNGLIERPVISYIGGNGNLRGDGITITGSYFNNLYRTQNIKVTSPDITKVARHCMSAEGSATNYALSVSITDPKFSYSAMAGIDIEDAANVTVEGRVRMTACGNDQTFYNPVALYGATFGLMAGFSVQNAVSFSNTLKGDVIIDQCYYGIQTGTSNGTTFEGVVIRNSVVADWLGNGLAQSATNLKMTNCRLESLVGSTTLYRSTNLTVGGFALKGNYFARPVTVQSYANVRINSGNTFAQGLSVVFVASVAPEIDDNIFLDFAGNQLTLGIASDLVPDPKIRRNVFQYAGSVTHNIFSPSDGITRAVIEGNSFEGALTANTNFSFNQTAIASYVNNRHNLAPYGFLTSGGMVGPCITGNSFRNISTYCINFNDIFSPLTMFGANICGNSAISGCVGGLRINLSTGTWNFVNVLGNNWNGCSGTKQSIPGVGNAGGFVAQNA